MNVVMFLVGFALGGGICWLVFRKGIADARQQECNSALADVRVAEERAAAKEATIAELRTVVSAKKQLLGQRDEENVQLKEQIAVLQTSLRNEEKKTDEKLTLLSKAKDQFVATLSEPVTETLEKLNAEITLVKATAMTVGAETSKLVKALQKPEVRGKWGEMHLRRVVELTGMTEHCDFYEQQTIGNENDRLRPDLIVRPPGGRCVAVDAKAPLRAFLDAAEAVNDETRETKLEDFVCHVRDHVRKLSSKAYHQCLDDSPEFVVLYLPTEAIFSTALTRDPELLEYAAKQHVHLAGPTILITLLRAVAYEWKQEAVAQNLIEIRGHAEELYKRLKDFIGHLINVGRHLEKSKEAYNSAIGSLDSRLMPHARKIEELRAAPDGVRIEQITQTDSPVRQPQCPEAMLERSDGEVEDSVSLPR